jgi:PAS domain S-box-containing protein
MISLSLRRLGRPTFLLSAFAAFAIAATLQLTGALRPIDNALADWRARNLARTVNPDIVIVEIDAASIDVLGEWPWPREYHAQLIGQVTRAAPRSLFLDLDFSTLSNTFDDALLETALARPRDYPLQLPLIMRPTAAPGATVIKAPRSRFVRGVELVIEAHELAADGLTRTWRNSWKREHGWQRSVIDPMRVLPEEHDVIIDYSILPSSFTRLSAADVLAGRVPLEALSGKRVFVGPTVAAIAYMLPVPVHGTLPAVVVQAIAYETVRLGAPVVPTEFKALLLIAGWTLLLACLYGKDWRRNLAVLVLSSSAAVIVDYLAFEHQRLWLGAAAPLIAGMALYVGSTLRSLDPGIWRTIASALGLRRDPRFDEILQGSGDALLCVDQHGAIRAANAAAARMFDCASHELVDQPLGRFVTMFAGEGAEARLVALEGQPRESDSRTLSGVVFPVELSSRKVRIDAARLFVVSVRDLRERRVGERRVGDRRQPHVTVDPSIPAPEHESAPWPGLPGGGGAGRQLRS